MQIARRQTTTRSIPPRYWNHAFQQLTRRIGPVDIIAMSEDPDLVRVRDQKGKLYVLDMTWVTEQNDMFHIACQDRFAMFELFVKLYKTGDMKLITSPQGKIGFQYPWWLDTDDDESAWFSTFVKLCEEGFLIDLFQMGFASEMQFEEADLESVRRNDQNVLPISMANMMDHDIAVTRQAFKRWATYKSN